MRPPATLVMAILVLCASVACNSIPPLANTSGSPEALAAAVLEALARGDRSRLDAMALNEQEFRDHVWPGLPAARPERNLPFSYVWKDLHQKSDINLSRSMAAQAGRRYTLQRVAFSGKTEYAGYVVHRDARFEVTDARGAPASLQVCGSFLEKDGAWKVFSYVVD